MGIYRKSQSHRTDLGNSEEKALVRLTELGYLLSQSHRTDLGNSEGCLCKP